MTEGLLDAYAEDRAQRTAGKSEEQTAGYRVVTREIEPGVVHREDGLVVTAFAVDHGRWEQAFGYRFESGGSVVVVSGDTRPAENTIKACSGCDVLVHEVYCQAGFDRNPPAWKRYHATHHTSTHELAELARKARPKLLVLSHVLFFGCSDDQLVAELKSRYDGAFVLGNDLDHY